MLEAGKAHRKLGILNYMAYGAGDIYGGGAYFILSTFTMSYIPYTALSAEMTHDPRERNILSGFRIFFSYFAVILVALLAKPIIDAFGGNRFGYLVMGGVFSLIFALPWITLVLGTWELPGSTAVVKKESFFKNFFQSSGTAPGGAIF